MRYEDILPNKFIYRELFKLYEKTQQTGRALQEFHRMKNSGIVDAIAFNDCIKVQ